MWEDLVKIDRDLFVYLNSSWLSNFDTFWLVVTRIENWIPLYIVFFYLLYKKNKQPYNLVTMVAIPLLAAFTLGLTNLVKHTVARLRPNNNPILMDHITILQTPENFSFWSGHSAVSFAVTTFVILVLQAHRAKRVYFLFYVWPVLFALSRIFNGVHYPADIAVGAFVGSTLGLLSYKIVFLLKHN